MGKEIVNILSKRSCAQEGISNPLDILLGVIILTAGFNTGRIVDRWVIPYINQFAGKEKETINSVKHSA
jgi:thiosulfate dehydrogenase (quinone) large subunit